MKIYLINPKPDCCCLFGEEVMNGEAVFIADNTTPTVAACVPSDIQVEICDERISAINFETDADWIGITGKLSQHKRLITIAKEFKKRNKKVLIGGSFAARFSDAIMPLCDILVRGELEEIAEKLFRDIINNDYKKEYIGTRPNPIITPIPRWDLYPTHKSIIGNIQITRGCPFCCDFCDVIQFHGQQHRAKTIDHVIKELDVLYKYYHTIFIVDDNIIANVPYALKLFEAIKNWNWGKNTSFIVQTPAYLAQNDRLLTLMAEAGVRQTYIGIESFDSEVLQSVHKTHNSQPTFSVVNKFLEKGIVPAIGIILGFDKDSSLTFDYVYEKCMELGTPIIALWALIAFPHTPFYDRMKAQGRIRCHLEQLSGYPWHSNIEPKNMTANMLGQGMYDLFNRLYTPEAFTKRLELCLGYLKPRPDYQIRNPKLAFNIFNKLAHLGPVEKDMCIYLLKKYKHQLGYVFNFLVGYAQARYLCARKYEEI